MRKETKEFSRTHNSTRNILAGLINKLVHLCFPFIIRSIIIQTLGANYLGLSSLFTSILQVLNLAELGFSNAIIYNMYKPVAKKDKKTICALLNFYKKIYRIIGIVVLTIGLTLLPFLRYLVKGDIPTNINIYVLYLLYVFSTASTYFLFAYKSALINAHQRNDIISNIYTATSLIQFLFQIAILLFFKDYYLYIIVQCASAILNNIWIAVIAKKRYPDYICAGEVPKEQKRDIRKRVTGLMVHRICATTRNSFDSIFISAMLGLSVVAVYSNYYTIMTAIIGVMNIITSSITASVGNSIITDTEEKNYHDMNKFNFVYMWLSGWVTACLACLYQPLMTMWMGIDNTFSYGIVILFCIYFYALKMGDIRATYSDAKGLWYENRYRAIAESIVNIILNLVLGHFFGVCGIIAGTLISLLIINFGYGSQILFKYYFKHHKSSEYFLRHGLYAAVTLIVCGITYFVCTFINLSGMAELVAKAAICLIVPNILYYLIYSHTNSFRESKAFINSVRSNIFPKKRKE